MKQIIRKTNQTYVGVLTAIFLLIVSLPSDMKAYQLENLASNKLDSINQVEVHKKSDQSLIVTIDVKDMKLSDVLNKLARQAHVGISYDGAINIEGLVTVKATDKPFFTLLDELLEEPNLKYTVSEDQRVVVVKEAQEDSVSEEFQEVVSGRVIDSQTGESLPGVNILVQGTSTGTSTDSEGNFEFEVPDLERVLIITQLSQLIFWKDKKIHK